MIEKHIEEMVGILNKVVPSGWERILLRAMILPASYSFKYYVKEEGKDGYLDNFALVDSGVITKVEMMGSFSKMRKISNIALDETVNDKKDKWMGYIMVLSKNDDKISFSVDYVYDEEEFNSNADWIQKYI